MTPEWSMFVLFLAACAAGFLGALTGLGGGVVIVPVLMLAFGVDLRYAVGTSLIAVIATSTGSAAAYVRDGFTNVRVGVLLEVATVVGAIGGALLAALLSPQFIVVLFVCALFYSALATLRPPAPHPLESEPDALATKLQLDGVYPTKDGLTPYRVRNVPWAFVIMIGAGTLSAIVGIGSGIIKVLAMDRLMRLPFKVSTTTSNFMIGVTAAASAGVYFHRGQIDPRIAAPVAIGALCGSFLGAKILPHAKVKTLRVIFAIIVAIAGTQMLMKGLNTTPNP